LLIRDFKIEATNSVSLGGFLDQVFTFLQLAFILLLFCLKLPYIALLSTQGGTVSVEVVFEIGVLYAKVLLLVLIYRDPFFLLIQH